MLDLDTIALQDEVTQEDLAFILGVHRISIPRMSRRLPDIFPPVHFGKHYKKFYKADQAFAFALAYFRLRVKQPNTKARVFFIERLALIESAIAKRAAAKGL